MGGTKNATSTSQFQLPQYLQNTYQGIIGQAQNTASQPYQAYTGGFTPDQQQAFQGIRNLAGASDPAFGASSTALSSSMVPTHSTVGAYMNPFQQNVIDTMMDTMQEQNQRQQQGVIGNAIAKGAFGGNRIGVAQAELARQQKLADNQTLAGLMSQNYTQGLGAAQADKQAQLQAAQQYAGLGQTQMQTGLAQTGAQLGAGTQQQQFDYQQYLNKLAFPYQQGSWLASIAGGLAPSAGGTTTETKPQGNIWSQLLGAGLGVASLFNRGGEVPKRAPGGVIPYANDNGAFPSYMDLGGGIPYANDNGDFGSYVPKVAQIGGGAAGRFPTISADEPETDFLSRHSSTMRDGASNIKSWLSPKPQLKLGYNLASGGVVPHFADGGGPPGTRARADYRGIAGSALPVLPRDDADMTVMRRDPVPSIVDSTFDALGFQPAALEELIAQAPRGVRAGGENEVTMAQGVDGRPVAVRTPQPQPSPMVASLQDEEHNIFDTLPPQSVERFSDPVGVAPATSGNAVGTGAGVVPYTRGEQFVTDPTPGYSRSIPEAWESLQTGKGLNLSPDMKQSLLAAGLGMMASKSPFALQGIGEGGLEGIAAWNERQKLERENAEARSAMGVSGQDLALRAQETASRLANEAVTREKDRFTFTATPYGIRIIDVLNPDQPRMVPYGEQLPDGTIASPAAGTGGLFSTSPDNVRVDQRLNVPESIPLILQQSQQVQSAANENAVSASQSKQQLEDMRHALEELPEDGLLVAGTDFDSRLALVKMYQTYMSAMGIEPDEQLAKEIASGENLKKLTVRLGQDLSRMLGSNNAAEIVTSSISAVPSAENSPEGARRIINALSAVNDRHMDWNNFLTNWLSDPRSGGSTLGALEEFNRMNPPELYALKSYIPMPALEYLAANPGAAADFNKKYGGGRDIARYVIGR